MDKKYRPGVITAACNLERLKFMASLKFKITLFVALTLLTPGAYFAITQFAKSVEPDPMLEFNSARPVTPGPGNLGPTIGLESVDVLLIGLKQRLETQPDDVDGWVLLSKSYYHLNRLTEADQAFEKAMTLGYKGDWQPLP